MREVRKQPEFRAETVVVNDTDPHMPKVYGVAKEVGSSSHSRHIILILSLSPSLPENPPDPADIFSSP